MSLLGSSSQGMGTSHVHPHNYMYSGSMSVAHREEHFNSWNPVEHSSHVNQGYSSGANVHVSDRSTQVVPNTGRVQCIMLRLGCVGNQPLFAADAATA